MIYKLVLYISVFNKVLKNRTKIIGLDLASYLKRLLLCTD